jgi:diacylglycerol kinase
MKFKIQNCLIEHLDITICMFVQDFCTKNTFLFQATIVDWNGEHKVRIEVNAWSLIFKLSHILKFDVISIIILILSIIMGTLCCNDQGPCD